MICAVQLLALDVAVGQVMAETADLGTVEDGVNQKDQRRGGGAHRLSLCRHQASPLPKTCFPLFCRVASIKPRKVGSSRRSTPQVSAEEGGVEQPLEPGYSQRAIARNRNRRFALALGTEQWRVGEVRLPVVVPASAKTVARDTSPTMAPSHRNSIFRFIGVSPADNSELRVCF